MTEKNPPDFTSGASIVHAQAKKLEHARRNLGLCWYKHAHASVWEAAGFVSFSVDIIATNVLIGFIVVLFPDLSFLLGGNLLGYSNPILNPVYLFRQVHVRLETIGLNFYPVISQCFDNFRNGFLNFRIVGVNYFL